MKAPRKSISIRGIDKILSFLPIFEKEDYEFGEVARGKSEDGTPYLPWVEYSEEVSAFRHALYHEGFIYSFDWSKWQKEAQRYCSDKETLKGADLRTIKKLLTTHIRKERFCEGHLLEMIESGHIVDLLKRLEEIRGKMIAKG